VSYGDRVSAGGLNVGEGTESRIGERLKAARERLGWSREELAVNAGVSWSAITQAETGRRRNLRPGTVSRLAGALGISIDYAINGGPAPPMLVHQALLYDGEEDFAERAGRFLVEGIERSEPAFASTTKRKLGRLRERLGNQADRVELVESAELYASPEAAVERLSEFMLAGLRDGAVWVRIVGEPIWKGRSAAEVRLWTRYESLLNLIFAGSPASVLCAYDIGALDQAIVSEAHATHPWTVKKGSPIASRKYRDPGGFVLES
jgi:transcriptional regulator with XRE-family HTH domain